MTHLKMLAQFTTIEQGKENLKQAVEIRDRVGGQLHWALLNADVCEIARKLKKMKAPAREVNAIVKPKS